MDAIDLTLSESEEDFRPAKRQRVLSTEDEVQVIEEPVRPASTPSGPEANLADGDDLVITKATGQVLACRHCQMH